jgi:hypothetical protein
MIRFSLITISLFLGSIFTGESSYFKKYCVGYIVWSIIEVRASKASESRKTGDSEGDKKLKWRLTKISCEGLKIFLRYLRKIKTLCSILLI